LVQDRHVPKASAKHNVFPWYSVGGSKKANRVGWWLGFSLAYVRSDVLSPSHLHHLHDVTASPLTNSFVDDVL